MFRVFYVVYVVYVVIVYVSCVLCGLCGYSICFVCVSVILGGGLLSSLFTVTLWGWTLVVGSDVFVVTHVSVMLGHGFREFGEEYAPFRGVRRVRA
jgi:hypothetical protein